VGVFSALIGLAVPAVHFLYDYSWFVGCCLSAAVYYGLMLGAKGTGAESGSEPKGSLQAV